MSTALKADAPAPVSPNNGTVLDTRQPTLSARGAAPTFQGADTSQLRHRFQLLANDGRVLFDSLVNGTSWTVPQVLPFQTIYRWQVRAEVGSTTTFYYRIHSPVILIEFDHQRPVGTTTLHPASRPTRDHIHTVVRTPNGNDCGKNLLRQHLIAEHGGRY